MLSVLTEAQREGWTVNLHLRGGLVVRGAVPQDTPEHSFLTPNTVAVKSHGYFAPTGSPKDLPTPQLARVTVAFEAIDAIGIIVDEMGS